MNKRKKIFLKKLTAVLLVLVFLMSGVSCGKGEDEEGYSKKRLATEAFGMNDDGAYVYNGPEANTAKQLTEQDIQDMNGGNALVVWDENHEYVTTIIGRFYDGKVTNMEEGIVALDPVVTLLGFTKGQEFFGLYGEKNAEGYMHFTYEQRYGNITIEYSTLRIFVDPEGYVCGLQNSFVPELGIADPETMSNQDAENIVLQAYSSAGVTPRIYSEYTRQVFYYANNHIVNCMVVYTDNPSVDASFDMPYLANYVDIENKCLLINMPTSSFEKGNGNIDEYNTDQYFENLEMQSWSGTVSYIDGHQEQITVPIGYNPKDGKYYLADKERKIMCANWWDFEYNYFTVNCITTDNNQGWDNEHLIAFYNYIRVYDYFASIGIRSIDGFGMPILLGVDFVDANHNPVDNACYMGRYVGWAAFCTSKANHCNQCIDVIGHEFTHGIRDGSMGSAIYLNELGAMHEAFSDVMGQLIELKLGATTDTSWLLGEHNDKTYRSMSNPNLYEQPNYVGDLYYVSPVRVDDVLVNDHGGVHINSSLMNSICYKLNLYGMTVDEQLHVWYNVIETMTPRGDYDDLYAALIFAFRVYGLTQYEQPLATIYQELGLVGDRIENARNATKPGCGRIRIQVADALKDYSIAVYVVTNSTMTMGFPDMQNNVVDMIVPAGPIQVLLLYRTNLNENPSVTGLDSSGNFFADRNSAAVFNVTEGETLDLGTMQ